MNILKRIGLALAIGVTGSAAMAGTTPSFENEQYQKALWMTARFYGAQRMGNDVNWLVAEHEPTDVANGIGFDKKNFVKGKAYLKDADGSYDLTGGWFDCGDFVLFGQTFYYSAYMLLLGYSEFPEGYDDYYSYDYHGYINSGDYTWEGGKGEPNGIPDILDEAKAATDYILKAFRDKNTFYYQKGDGDADHKVWCTSPVKSALSKSNGGEADGSRVMKSATGGATSMAALGGAALAIMARAYAKFDPEYANKCLEKALVAYEYVKGTSKGNTDGGGYYPAKGKYEPDMAIFYGELYRTTGESKYLEEAEEAAAFMNDDKGWNHNYSLNYNNTEDLCYYVLGACGNTVAKERLQYYVETLYKPTSGYFLNKKNGDWGILRFPANQAFVYGLYSKLSGAKEIDPYALTSVEYIMGKNGANFSYIVGFGSKHPFYPHHRNFYLSDGNSEGNLPKLNSSYKFIQLGYMVGGSINDGAYTDDEKSYTYSEGGIDYNAGLVGALGYINSLLNPVNTNKFGHPTPDLGENQSICGLDNITLDSKIAPAGEMTFTWYLDGQKLESSKTASTYKATKAGKYTCELDSAGDWSTSADVTILAEMPTVNVQEKYDLCDPAYVDIDLSVFDANNATYSWLKNSEEIKGENSSSYRITSAGSYTCIVEAKNCESVEISTEVSSKLPEVENVISDENGNVTLTIKNEGDYEWYDVAEGGTPLSTGSSYSTKITKDTEFYVQNAGSMSLVAGPTDKTFTAEGVNWGNIGAKFTASKECLITSITASVMTVNTSDKRSLTAELEHNGKKTTFTSESIQVTKGNVVFTFSNPIEITEAGDYTLTCKGDAFDIAFYQNGPDYSTYANNGEPIAFTGATNGQANNNPFPGLLNWNITAGSGCARAVVIAKLNSSTSVENTKANICNIYPNPASDEITINITEEDDAVIELINTLGVIVLKENLNNKSNTINISNLNSGIYNVRIQMGNNVINTRLIKQ